MRYWCCGSSATSSRTRLNSPLTARPSESSCGRIEPPFASRWRTTVPASPRRRRKKSLPSTTDLRHPDHAPSNPVPASASRFPSWRPKRSGGRFGWRIGRRRAAASCWSCRSLSLAYQETQTSAYRHDDTRRQKSYNRLMPVLRRHHAPRRYYYPLSSVFYRKLNRPYNRIVRGEGCWLFDESGKRYLD